jgi:hypothetical protein
LLDVVTKVKRRISEAADVASENVIERKLHQQNYTPHIAIPGCKLTSFGNGVGLMQ